MSFIDWSEEEYRLFGLTVQITRHGCHLDADVPMGLRTLVSPRLASFARSAEAIAGTSSPRQAEAA